jgi:hypothetical protein
VLLLATTWALGREKRTPREMASEMASDLVTPLEVGLAD